jgi:hypothetical protein
VVEQLVESLLYKLEGRGFRCQLRNFNFLLTKSFRPRYDAGIDSQPLTEMNINSIFGEVKAAGA